MLLNCGVGEDSWESPLDCKQIQPVHPKGNQSWVFIGRTDIEAETPISWFPDPKTWLFWKDPDAGKDWRQEEKGPTEDKMVGWHHRHNGHEFGWALGVGVRQGGLACCGSWGRKELAITEWLNRTDWVEKLEIYFLSKPWRTLSTKQLSSHWILHPTVSKLSSPFFNVMQSLGKLV